MNKLEQIEKYIEKAESDVKKFTSVIEQNQILFDFLERVKQTISEGDE